MPPPPEGHKRRFLTIRPVVMKPSNYFFSWVSHFLYVLKRPFYCRIAIYDGLSLDIQRTKSRVLFFFLALARVCVAAAGLHKHSCDCKVHVFTVEFTFELFNHHQWLDIYIFVRSLFFFGFSSSILTSTHRHIRVQQSRRL